MTEPNSCQIDPEQVAALYVRHGDELRAFLTGVLRDRELVQDAMQSAFTKAIEKGVGVKEESLKSWLFQVGYREALLIRRRQNVDGRAMEILSTRDQRKQETVEETLVKLEHVRSVQTALDQLSAAQREIVRLRIYEDMKFTDIASQLKLPLGTVLARMQAALKRLRERMKE